MQGRVHFFASELGSALLFGSLAQGLIVDVDLLLLLFGSASERTIMGFLVDSVHVRVIIVGLRVRLEHDLGLFVEQLLIFLASVDVLIEHDVLFDATLSVGNVAGLVVRGQTVVLAIIVLEAHFVLLRWFNVVVLILKLVLLCHLCFWLLREALLLLSLHLERVVEMGVNVLVAPLGMGSSSLARVGRAVRHLGSLAVRVRQLKIATGAVKSSGLTNDELFLAVHGNAGAILVPAVSVPSDFVLVRRSSIRHRLIRCAVIVGAQRLCLCLVRVEVARLAGLDILLALILLLPVSLVHFPQSSVKVVLTVPCYIFVDFCLVYVRTAKALRYSPESAVRPTTLICITVGRLFSPPLGIDHAIDRLAAGTSFVRFGSLFVMWVVDLVSRQVGVARVRAISAPAPA
jgi:hypothetical protein